MSAPSAPQRFPLPARVQDADIDGLGHVNNIVYLRWVQDAATAHWEVLAPPEVRSEIHWVVLRHEIDYKSPALPGDELLVETWIGAASGLSFERHTEILRAADRRLLARARTLWCPINARTGRPQRVSVELRALFSVAASER